jgi:hypothetical protein
MATVIQTLSGDFTLNSFQFRHGIWMYGGWSDSNDTTNTVLYLRTHKTSTSPF